MLLALDSVKKVKLAALSSQLMWLHDSGSDQSLLNQMWSNDWACVGTIFGVHSSEVEPSIQLDWN